MQTVSGIGYSRLSARRPSSPMARLWRAGRRDTWAPGWRSAMRNIDTRTAGKVPDGLDWWSQITAESDRDFLSRASALTPVGTNKYHLYGYSLQISWSVWETTQAHAKNSWQINTKVMVHLGSIWRNCKRESSKECHFHCLLHWKIKHYSSFCHVQLTS